MTPRTRPPTDVDLPVVAAFEMRDLLDGLRGPADGPDDGYWVLYDERGERVAEA